MTDWKTIKVPPEDKERADDYRPEESTWGECLVAGAERLNDHLDSDPPAGVDVPVFDADKLVDQIRDQFDGALTEDDMERLNKSLATIEERTGRIEKQLDDLGGQR